MSEREFIAWPKIARLEGETMTITEKIDGTNACIIITEDDIYAQSRNRIITPENDNAGFAAWVDENWETLSNDLGVGRHFGEWWGRGIQRNYGQEHRRFSLFNTYKHADKAPYFETPFLDIVPVLWEGDFHVRLAFDAYDDLKDSGSVAAPGFVNPEGVVVFLNKSHTSYKITDAVVGQKPRLPSE